MTADFESGGYKWYVFSSFLPKTSIQRKRNYRFTQWKSKQKWERSHSLYLVISDTSSLHFGWEVNVILRLFLFDQIRDKYLVIEDCRGGFSPFHELKTECGFSRFVSRETFYDPHNGFLVDDNCAFGVELFVRKSTVTVRGESLSMLRKATTIKHSWKWTPRDLSSTLISFSLYPEKKLLYRPHLFLSFELPPIAKENMNTRPQPEVNNIEERVIRSTRELPPFHYNFKIQSFSLLSKNSVVKYDSAVFESGRYKWKLSLYPKGNADKNGNGHISLYLVMTETESLTSGWEVSVVYRLFLYDQIRDKYLTVEDNNGGRYRRFHGLKTEWGFSQLISHVTFYNSCNGYLVDDTCVFGAEIFVYKSTGKGESLSMVKDAAAVNFTWKIESFSQKGNLLKSEMFTAANHKWNLELYPKGHSIGKNKYASVYLRLADSKTTSTGGKVFAKFVFRAKYYINGNHLEHNFTQWFCKEGDNLDWLKVLELKELINKTKGFLLNDALIVEAEVTVLGISKTF
ncbi:hypothetical protein GIB67_027168 [Kingdonia uniflora]|uniref:MATH domain-containing protein n=1 Tax=Kingdonia uniflora TaxID=39325 RepID=A0A7J7P2C6_9MAGN|nr:hypothetical protein GIB67_027168 [Kingdonia uniflora]